MAASLTLQDTKSNPTGDNDSRHYKCTLTGNYPSGGYTINSSQFPSSEAKFSTIYRIYFNGGPFDANGIMFRADPDEFDNSDTDDPEFVLRAYEQITGGAGYTEISAGDALATSINMIIEGTIIGGVVSDPW